MAAHQGKNSLQKVARLPPYGSADAEASLHRWGRI
jgi:hypothetical protein